MITKLLPILLLLIGVGGGVGAGLALKPRHAESELAQPCGDVKHSEIAEEAHHDDGHEVAAATEYVKLNNQFLVPIVDQKRVESLVIMSLSIEVSSGNSDTVFQREPKLRDGLLQVLFDHANIGGFQGEFTNAKNLEVLRGALTDMAQDIVGAAVSGVLITDIARQDI